MQLVADGGAKPDRSRKAADSIRWKFGVSNITKHLERVHSMKLKECGMLDCYNKASKVSTWHPVSFLRCQVPEFVVKSAVITVG